MNKGLSTRRGIYAKLWCPLTRLPRYLVRGLDALCQANMEELFPWPTCEEHYNLVKDCPDFYSWSWTVQHDPHGPVHAFLGGMIDCKDKYNAIGDLVGEVIARKMAYSSVSSIKELYRNGIFKCKETVDESVAPDEVISRRGAIGHASSSASHIFSRFCWCLLGHI